MTGRIVYCRGEFVPEDQAVVPLMDRGLLFADAVYEGLGILDGKLIDFPHHHARLVRSLGELGIAEPFTAGELWPLLMELIDTTMAGGRPLLDRDPFVRAERALLLTYLDDLASNLFTTLLTLLSL